MSDENRVAWLAFDIGCIECGESSSVVGIFSDKDEAESALTSAELKQKANWTGQHSFELFDISDAVATRERAAAAKALREAADWLQQYPDTAGDGETSVHMATFGIGVAAKALRTRAAAVERGSQ